MNDSNVFCMQAKWPGVCQGCQKQVLAGTWQRVRKQSPKWAVLGCEQCDAECQRRARRGGTTGGGGGDGGGDAITLEAYVEKVKSSKPETGWAAVVASYPKGITPAGCPRTKTVNISGTLGDVRAGDTIRVTGTFTQSEKWGWELKSQGYAQMAVADGDEGMVVMLQRIDGIGPVRARKIVQALGGAAAVKTALASNPAAMCVVPGITQLDAVEFAEAYRRNTATWEAIEFVSSLGLGQRTIQKVVDHFGEDAKSAITENPFTLLEVDGISFPMADKVATKLMMVHDHPMRLEAAAEHTLEGVTQLGHTWSMLDLLCGQGPYDDETVNVAKRTKFGPAQLRKGFELLAQPRTVTRRGRTFERDPVVLFDGDRVAPAELVEAEKTIAAFFRGAQEVVLNVPESVFSIDGKPLSEEQVAAVRMAATSTRMVLRGGPGRGKTHVTKAVIAMFKANGLSVACAAPTGKAAVRMAELTGAPTSTIHRLLAYAPGSGFRRNQEEAEFDEHGQWLTGGPVDADVVIVDEVSMVDTSLMEALVLGMTSGQRLVCVGDADQLPSIGPGQVLFDLVESNAVPVATLTKIFRQAADSAIPWLADAINNGDAEATAEYLMSGEGGVHFTDEPDPARAAARIVEMVVANPSRVVITPQKTESKACATYQLNGALQAALNPKDGRPKVPLGEGYEATEGDKVIQTKNNYDLRIFNGESGRVVAVGTAKDGSLNPKDIGPDVAMSKSKRKVMLVDFTSNPSVPRVVAYDYEEARQLQLAYAVTGHRYQGSQALEVIIPVVEELSFMLRRKWTYTAVTRAAKTVTLIGDIGMAKRAARVTDLERRTSLRERLQGGETASAPRYAGMLDDVAPTPPEDAAPAPSIASYI